MGARDERHFVLVLNSGSSSLKYQLINLDEPDSVARGLIEEIGEQTSSVHHTSPDGDHDEQHPCLTHHEALLTALRMFREYGPALSEHSLLAVGHRVVHGGARYSGPAIIDDDVITYIEGLADLAPLHNKANAEGARVARRLLPDIPHVAVFDTSFHHTLPEHAYTYAVPKKWRTDSGVRRFGFHGTSYAYVSGEACRILGRPVEAVNLVILHLGNGASAVAVRGGVSIDTSMGMTPLEGLVMGTRSGDLDPAVASHLARTEGLNHNEIDRMLNFDSGLKAFSGNGDFRELMEQYDAGEAEAQLGFEVTCYRIRKYVGSYAVALGRLDGLVFTGGIGENSALLRKSVGDGLGLLGVDIDDARNRADSEDGRIVSSEASAVAVLVVPTDEERQIAVEVSHLVRDGGPHR